VFADIGIMADLAIATNDRGAFDHGMLFDNRSLLRTPTRRCGHCYSTD
jgi:hypothetical protein